MEGRQSGRECVSGRQVSGADFESCSWAGRPSDRPPVACPPALHPHTGSPTWHGRLVAPRRIPKEARRLSAGSAGGGLEGPLLRSPHSSDSWLLALLHPRRQRVHGPLYALYTRATTTLSGQPLFACINNNSAQRVVRTTRYLAGTPPRALQPFERLTTCREEHWTEGNPLTLSPSLVIRNWDPFSRPTRSLLCVFSRDHLSIINPVDEPRASQASHPPGDCWTPVPGQL